MMRVWVVAVGIWVGLAMCVLAAEAEYKAGDAVQVEMNGRWLGAKVLEKKTGKYLVRFDGLDAAFDELVPVAKLRVPVARFKVGDTVDAEIGTKWLKAKVLEVKPSEFKVHFEALDTAFDDWIPAARIREPGSGAVAQQPAAAQPPATPQPARPAAPKPPPAARPAAEPALEVGSVVQITVDGKWYPGKIVEKRPNGVFAVEVNVNGEKIKRLVMLDSGKPDARPPVSDDPPVASTVQPSPAVSAPIKPAISPRKPDAGAVSAGAGVQLPPITEADLTTAKTPNLASVPEDWKFPATSQPAAPTLCASFSLPRSSATQNIRRGNTVFTGPPSYQMVTVYNISNPEDRANGYRYKLRESRIVRVDLRTGADTGTYVLPRGSQPVGVSGDGQYLLVRYDSAGIEEKRDEQRVDFFKLLPAGKIEHLAGWVPHTRKFSGVEVADVLGPELVLTHEDFYDTTLWKLPECRAVWTATRKGAFNPPAISPDRKYLAMTLPDGLFVIESETGIAVAKLEAENARGSTVWHPDGTKLAKFGNRVIVWDMVNHKRLHDFALPKGSPTGVLGLAWSGQQHLMCGGQFLLDLERGMVVWNYLPPEILPKVIRQPDARFWTCADSFGCALVALNLPHDAARQVIAGAAKDPWAVPAASRMSIQMNLAGDAAKRETELQQRLKEKIAKAGHQFDDQKQPVQVVLEIRQGAGVQVQYGEGARGGDNVQTVSSATFECKLALVADGREIWSSEQRTGGNNPSSARLLPGQTIQQYIDDSNGKSYEWFLKELPDLPRKVAFPRDKPGFGASRITLTGPVPAEMP